MISFNFDMIKDRKWKFFRENGRVVSEFFQFNEDGSIAGYQHPNEKFWAIEDGVICLQNKNRKITTRFSSISREGGKYFLKGEFIANPEIMLCLMEQNPHRVQNNATKTALKEQIKKFGWSIGDHTYGVPKFHETGMAKFSIGKYCSLADGLKIALGNHRTDTFTTYPFKALGRFWQNVPPDTEDHHTKGDVTIGSDVWIGTDVFIGSGVTIGSGAVIGAKSVIARDVPPYAIVAGNPGRILRYRFEPDRIAELLRLAWWDLDDDAVDALLPQLMATDAEAFLDAVRRARGET